MANAYVENILKSERKRPIHIMLRLCKQRRSKILEQNNSWLVLEGGGGSFLNFYPLTNIL